MHFRATQLPLQLLLLIGVGSITLKEAPRPDEIEKPSNASSSTRREVEVGNETVKFKASLHLGTIEETGPVKGDHPFNRVKHVEFDNVLGAKNDARLSEKNSETEADSNRVKFQDEAVYVVEPTAAQRPIKFESQEYYHHHHREPSENPLMVQTNLETPDASQGYGLAQTLQPINTPIYQYQYVPSSSIFDKPGEANSDKKLNPHQHSPSWLESTQNPDNAFLVLHQQRQSTFTRTRKFPYQFYYPGLHPQYEHGYFLHYPRETRVSPWKKIIHLIGTFLPLGLLLATLTPNVVRVENTTNQPNIVLSKWRGIDLPAEHKEARDEDRDYRCEERKICQLILNGSNPQSNILQNLLWNLASRVSTEEANKNGLKDVFEAVKQKDCQIIEC